MPFLWGFFMYFIFIQSLISVCRVKDSSDRSGFGLSYSILRKESFHFLQADQLQLVPFCYSIIFIFFPSFDLGNGFLWVIHICYWLGFRFK